MYHIKLLQPMVQYSGPSAQRISLFSIYLFGDMLKNKSIIQQFQPLEILEERILWALRSITSQMLKTCWASAFLFEQGVYTSKIYYSKIWILYFEII